MAAKNPRKRPTRRTTTARKPVRKPTRKKVAHKPAARRPPRGKGWQQRVAVGLARFLARAAESRRATVRSRKDAAILRATHAGCARCNGTGTIATHGKDGRLTGSKSCTAKPQTMKVSRFQVAKQARFGVDKNSGLMGWRCPCGKREKPRYRDAKTATQALRTHERQKHGGASVGGTWYQQLPETAKPAAQTTPAPVSKTAVNSGMTDQQWEKQNKPMHPGKARAKGLCWQCAGQGALYTAFGGEQKTVVCNECTGTGKAAATAGRP